MDFVLDGTGCPSPGCTFIAAIVERVYLESTDGPIEHVRTVCSGVTHHRFFVNSGRLEHYRSLGGEQP